MGNTISENKTIDVKKTSKPFSEIFTSTKISIPNEKRDEQVAEDQICLLELFISPDKSICILILKEKTFTGNFQPIYYIHIYYYDSIKNEFVIVLNHTIKNEINNIEQAIYDPNNNYILCYNCLKEISDDENKFFLFKFEFLTRENPKLGMNGYNMTKLLHPHINFFGKCRYATFLQQSTELLFVFEKGYFILLTYDKCTNQYSHINYFSSRSSWKYLLKKRYKNSQSSPPHHQVRNKKKKRGYKVIMASVHEKRDRITWIECEYNHYYLQIFSLKCILNNKRQPILSHELCSEDINISECIATPPSPPSPISPSLSSMNNPVLKITPISIDIEKYLIVSRLIFANKKDLSSIRYVFSDNYDLEQFHEPTDDHYGATKYREVIRKESDNDSTNNNNRFILGSFFGINPIEVKLLFNRNGDKIFYQSTGQMLHANINYGENVLSHGDQYSGNLNDYGALHVIDVTTGNSIWSLGSSSKDIGFGWFNSYLIVLPSISSSSGLASSKSIYNPYKNNKHRKSHRSLSMPSIRNTIMNGNGKRKHSHLKLYGFVSETSIAESIYNKCCNIEYINEFSWDLCVMIALYCGGMREYRQLSLTKWIMKHKTNKISKSNMNMNSMISNIKLMTNEILSIWNTNDNYYNLHSAEKRDWLIIALKEYRNNIRYIDIVFYDAQKIAMHENDIFIPYNDWNLTSATTRQWYNGLICRNLLGKSSTFDSLYYA